jgi:hypothetical protein
VLKVQGLCRPRGLGTKRFKGLGSLEAEGLGKGLQARKAALEARNVSQNAKILERAGQKQHPCLKNLDSPLGRVKNS